MRDLIKYAAIALTSSIGLILPELHRRIAGTPTAIAACFVLWLLSFVIISPMVFGYDLLGYNFGRFGWNAGGGRCDVIHLESDERSRFRGDGAYVYGMAIPCVVIFIRYCNLTPHCSSGANAGGRPFCHELDIGWVHIVQWIFSILAISAGLFWRKSVFCVFTL